MDKQLKRGLLDICVLAAIKTITSQAPVCNGCRNSKPTGRRCWRFTALLQRRKKMTKKAFLSELRAALSALPEQERDERLRFYAEMIDDRMEDGMTEEEAVAAVGNTNEIAQRIHTEAAVQAPQQGVRVWLILLLVLGSPLWLSLYAALWAVIISLWAVFVSFAAVSLSGYVAAPAFGVHGNFPMAAASLGAGLFMTGCTIFLFFGCLAASKGVCRLTKKIFAGIRRSDGKERLQ